MTLWGRLEHRAERLPEECWVQIRVIVQRHGVILRQIIIGNQTRLAKGVEPVALANLREGEVVGIIFRAACAGHVADDTIYASPECVMNESMSSSSAWPQSSPKGSMQQAPADSESGYCYSDPPRRNTSFDSSDDVPLLLMRQRLRPEVVDSRETNTRGCEGIDPSPVTSAGHSWL